jgi:hypothetical protein
VDELIERLRKLAEWPFDYGPAITSRLAERAAAALEAAREDARAVYAKIPQLPVKPETCEQATDAFTAFCMAFGEHIDQARGKGGQEVGK